MAWSRQELTEGKRRLVARVLDTYPCCICAESDPAVLTLHHLEPKFRNLSYDRRTRGANGRSGISELVSIRCSVAKLVEEINKCCVLCANCHVRVHKSVVGAERLAQIRLVVPPKGIHPDDYILEIADSWAAKHSL